MNKQLTYKPPVIDFARRNYDKGTQTMLEMMLQRDPKMRKDLKLICKFPLVSDIYKDLCKEEQDYNLKYFKK
jgi:hypothetical protein